MSDRSRPRVTASHVRDGVAITSLFTPGVARTPRVELHVAFDLHDHHAALSALEAAVADVRAQIEETR